MDLSGSYVCRIILCNSIFNKNAGNQSTYSSSTSGFEIQSTTIQPDKYWSTVEISEEEFYQYLEEQLTEDEYYDYIYNEFYSTQDM